MDVQEVRRTLFVPSYDDGLVSLSKFNGEHVMMINHDNLLFMSFCFVFFVLRQCIYPLVYPFKKKYIYTRINPVACIAKGCYISQTK